MSSINLGKKKSRSTRRLTQCFACVWGLSGVLELRTECPDRLGLSEPGVHHFIDPDFSLHPSHSAFEDNQNVNPGNFMNLIATCPTLLQVCSGSYNFMYYSHIKTLEVVKILKMEEVGVSRYSVFVLHLNHQKIGTGCNNDHVLKENLYVMPGGWTWRKRWNHAVSPVSRGPLLVPIMMNSLQIMRLMTLWGLSLGIMVEMLA